MLQSDKEFEKQILASLNQNRVRAKNVSGIFINVFLILIKLSIKTYCDYYIVDFGYVSVTSNSCQEIYFLIKDTRVKWFLSTNITPQPHQIHFL